jgi:hypothetical protein
MVQFAALASRWLWNLHNNKFNNSLLQRYKVVENLGEEFPYNVFVNNTNMYLIKNLNSILL